MINLRNEIDKIREKVDEEYFTYYIGVRTTDYPDCDQDSQSIENDYRDEINGVCCIDVTDGYSYYDSYIKNGKYSYPGDYVVILLGRFDVSNGYDYGESVFGEDREVLAVYKRDEVEF